MYLSLIHISLDEFYHDRAHVVPRLGLDALQSGVGVAESLVEGEEIVVIALLPGGGEGGDCLLYTSRCV